MIGVLLHFLAGSLGALAVFLLFNRGSGRPSFSLPVAPLLIGLIGAVLAHFVSPWATPGVVTIYALACLGEWSQDRSARIATGRSRDEP